MFNRQPEPRQPQQHPNQQVQQHQQHALHQQQDQQYRPVQDLNNNNNSNNTAVNINIKKTPLVRFFWTLWYFIILPFFVSIYESIAIWRVVKYWSRSEPLRKAIKHCILLNGVALLGSILFEIYILQPLLHTILTLGHSHLCTGWIGGDIDIDNGLTAINIINDLTIASLTTQTIVTPTVSSTQIPLKTTALPPTLSTCGFFFTETILTIIFNLLWTIPIYLTSLVTNGIWHGKIAEEMCKLTADPNYVNYGENHPNNNQNVQVHHNNNNANPVHHHNPNDIGGGNAAAGGGGAHGAAFLPLQLFTLIGEQLSRIAIFLILLIQATILSFFSLPSIIPSTLLNLGRTTLETSTIIDDNVVTVYNNTSITWYTPILVAIGLFFRYFDYIWTHIPIILSYCLTSISYTYAMFEFTWTSSSSHLTRIYRTEMIRQVQRDLQAVTARNNNNNDNPNRPNNNNNVENNEIASILQTRTLILHELSILRNENNNHTQLPSRFRYTEYRSTYYIGFSIVMTVLTFPLPFLMSISIFGLIFPLNLLTSLVATGHIDMLDSPLFPKVVNNNNTSNNNNTTRIAIPPNTTQDDALSIIYTAHDLYVPPRINIFGIPRWLNDSLLVFVNKHYFAQPRPRHAHQQQQAQQQH